MNGVCTFERSKHSLIVHNGDTFSDSPLFIYLLGPFQLITRVTKIKAKRVGLESVNHA
jgi:hypothetical protein